MGVNPFIWLFRHAADEIGVAGVSIVGGRITGGVPPDARPNESIFVEGVSAETLLFLPISVRKLRWIH